MKRTIIPLLILSLIYPFPIFAANIYVRPASDCTYSGDGTTWGCAASAGAAGAFAGFPVNASNILKLTSIPKGSLVYLAGSDNAYNYMRIDNTDSTGEPERIVFRGATASDHGTDTGWDSSFGTKQVLLNGGVAFTASNGHTTGYITFDGVTRTSVMAGHRIKCLKTSGTCFSTSGSSGDGYSQYITLQYMEIAGYDGHIPDLCYDDGICGNGIGLIGYSAKTENITVQYNYIHDTFTPIAVPNTSYITVKNNYIARNESSSANHSNGVDSAGPADNLVIDANWIEDIQGTGWIALLGGSSLAAFDTIRISNNIFVDKNTNPSNALGVAHGIVTLNRFGNQIKNLTVINNTVVGTNPYDSNGHVYLRSGCAGNCKIENNLWYTKSGTAKTAGVSSPNATVLHFIPKNSTSTPAWTDNNAAVTCTNGSGTIAACASQSACSNNDIIDYTSASGNSGSIRLASPTGTFAEGDTCTTAAGNDFTITGVSVPGNVTSRNNYYYGYTADNLTETGSKYPISDESPFVNFAAYNFHITNNGNSALNNGTDVTSFTTADYDGATIPTSNSTIGALQYTTGAEIIKFNLGTGAGFRLGTGAGFQIR